MDVTVADDAPALDRSERADTVVIGSGIAGLSAAYELASAGHSVVVLDRGAIGMGMTARTTAHLTATTDDSTEQMIKLRGEDMARLFYQSQMAAIDRVEAIQAAEGIRCDFRRLNGYLFPSHELNAEVLDSELAACRRIGIGVTERVGLPFAGHAGVRCLRFADFATFHPLKYLRGLASAIQARNGRLYADTAVMSVEEENGVVRVKTKSGHTVHAAAAVVATNSPIVDWVALHNKQFPYRTYALAVTIPHDIIEDALYWDTLDPYHYVRLQPGRGTHDYLIVGGADHKTGEADDGDVRLDALEAWIRNLIPNLGKVTHRWSGQVMETMDYAGFIGRNPDNENIYVATGDSGQGMTHGALSAILNSDLILKGKSPWEELYDPSRKTLAAAGNVLSESLTVVKNFAEYVAPGEIGSYDELKPGQGAIVRQGLKKIAAYREEDGRLLLRSAACSHLGCHLHWNSFERCWDCPCHGSHFAPDGRVLNSPAIGPLTEVEQAGERKPQREAS